MKLIVSGLPRDMYEGELKEIFEEFGRVMYANIVIDAISLKSKGTAFVEMPDNRDAQRAIKELDGASIEDKVIKVKADIDKKPFAGGGGRDGFRSTSNRGGGGYSRDSRGGDNRGGDNRGGDNRDRDGGYNREGYNRNRY